MQRRAYVALGRLWAIFELPFLEQRTFVFPELLSCKRSSGHGCVKGYVSCQAWRLRRASETERAGG